MKTLKIYNLIGISLLAAQIVACGGDDKKESSARLSALGAAYGAFESREIKFPAGNENLVKFEEIQEGRYDLEAVRALIDYGNEGVEFKLGFDLNDERKPSEKYCEPNDEAIAAQKSSLRYVYSEMNAPWVGFVANSDLVELNERFMRLTTRKTKGGSECSLDLTWEENSSASSFSITAFMDNPFVEEKDGIYKFDFGSRSMRLALLQVDKDHLVVILDWKRSGMKSIQAFLLKRTDLPSDYAVAKQEAEVTEPSSSSSIGPTEYEIELQDYEVEFSSVENGNAATRDGNGDLVVLTSKTEARDYAQSNQYDVVATEDMFEMSSRTGGVLSFAGDKADLSQSILDHMGHMKSRMNANNGNLDLVFVLDYSGSMSDDISAVIDTLEDITHSINSVVDSWRTARVAIVTFGRATQEKVELDFSSDMNQVRAELSDILTNYGSNQHSTNPGEACYHGILCSATQLSWSAQNRMSIVITDEPSFEAQTGDQITIDRALNELSKNGITGSIYTIVTK